MWAYGVFSDESEDIDCMIPFSPLLEIHPLEVLRRWREYKSTFMPESLLSSFAQKKLCR